MSIAVRQSLDHCVKCTICDTFCPFSAATPLFPGPKYVGPQLERFRTRGESPDASLDYCSGCGICTQVCPQGVKIAEINSQARAAMRAVRGIPLRDRLIARPSVTGRLGTPVAPLANRMLESPFARLLAERTLGIHHEAPLPRLAGRTFQSWARRHAPRRGGAGRVVYFHGCGTNFYEPRTGEMTVAVLERNGFEVVVPPQDCCGLPLQSNGIFPAARRYVRRLAARLAPYAREGVPIVASSTSCGLMLKREAREILDVDDDDLAVVSEHVVDLSEFLRDLLDADRLDLDMQPVPLRVPYHAPCQQRGHGIGKPAVDVLSFVPELELVELEAECCGIAGTYGLKREKYDVAMRVGDSLFRMIGDVGADVVACDSETCRWQITHATGVRSVHPIELLHRAYGLA